MSGRPSSIHAVFVNRFYHPDLSATSRLLTQLTEDLADSGAAVTVITGRWPYVNGTEAWPADGYHKGVAIRRAWSTNFGRRSDAGRLIDYLTFFTSALWMALRVRGVHWLIVMTDPPMLSILAPVVKWIKSCRTMCWLQDVFPQIAIHSGVLKQGRLSTWLSRLGRYSLESMDRVVVLGRCMERVLAEQGLSGRNIVRIPNWADGGQVYPTERRCNRFVSDHGLLQHFVAMYSGNLGVVHDIATIEQVLRATSRLQNFMMCVVGEGTHKQRLERQAQREQWSHVKFVSYQPEVMLSASLGAAQVHLVTLKWNMAGLSVPSKIYGILAAGRPVIFIGPQDSEVSAIVRDARCGHVISPGDWQAVVNVLTAYRDEPELAHRHGSRARVYFETHCSRSLSTRRFLELLRSPAPFGAALALEPSAAERGPFPERFVHR